MSNSEENTEELVEYRGKRIYAEVAEYFNTATTGERAYEDLTYEADYAFNVADRQMRRIAQDEGRTFDRYGGHDGDNERRRAAIAARDAGYEAARQARKGSLEPLATSPHKEVKWIHDEILAKQESGSEQWNYAMAILKVLPATEEELWRVAKSDHGMCEVFDQYYDKAAAAGVFGENGMPGQRELASLRSYIRRNYGGSYVGSFMDKLNPAMKAMREDYDRRLGEAKAEWQKQDEAYAENTRRNRSDGARRAAETRRRNAAERQEAEEDITTPAPHPAAQAAAKIVEPDAPIQADPFEQPRVVMGANAPTGVGSF